MAPTNWKRAGNSQRCAARAMVMEPVSSGSRRASSAVRGNSGISSKNKTPWWARETSPGRGGVPLWITSIKWTAFLGLDWRTT